MIQNNNNNNNNISNGSSSNSSASSTRMNSHSESTANTNSSCNVSNGGNVSETAANLEMSLKNSAEILRNLSVAGEPENLHKLEQVMQQSMQLIEKLKNASKQQQLSGGQQQQPQQKIKQKQSESKMSRGKIRSINSMPSSLKDMGKNIIFINLHRNFYILIYRFLTIENLFLAQGNQFNLLHNSVGQVGSRENLILNE